MKRLLTLLCWLGIHRWHYPEADLRTCSLCGRRQYFGPDESGWTSGEWLPF